MTLKVELVRQSDSHIVLPFITLSPFALLAAYTENQALVFHISLMQLLTSSLSMKQYDWRKHRTVIITSMNY